MGKLTYSEFGQLLWTAAQETFIMVSWSLLAAIIFGTLIGLFLYLTSNRLFFSNQLVNQISGFIINATRSIPFLILMVAVLPAGVYLVGTSIGPKAVIFPLAVAAIAFYGRLAENAFSQVDNGVIEAAISSGAAYWRIIVGILFPEAFPQLIRHATVTVISLIGYSAMAGIVGGGGIGDLAIRYGYQRYYTEVLVACIVILIIVVQLLQFLGDMLANRLDKRHK
ncbi:D-methionine transport system permease protein [Orbus hercynius]|uniref:D-methionine transport system permease protein n=1 Tax=Orbus hercynius TaxID=593135 RepID=A0A495RBI0_9GAMM|nr:methionine ABC transporter permease [Orbus hercynius]RKS84765.1 D-methionine transport system permease protein [Orbus hercynius]